MAYRMRLLNLVTGQSMLTTMNFKNKKEAIEWADKWTKCGAEYCAEVVVKEGKKFVSIHKGVK